MDESEEEDLSTRIDLGNVEMLVEDLEINVRGPRELLCDLNSALYNPLGILSDQELSGPSE